MANFNGNSALFLSCLITGLMPSMVIVQGRNPATTLFFGYITLTYGLIYFTEFTTPNKSTMGKTVKTTRNDNETHYSGAILGLLLGLILRLRLN